jgi:GxxExxY protein
MGFDPTNMRTMGHGDLPPELNRLSERVIGCAMHVHSLLGPGLREKFYEQALALELGRCGLRADRQVPFKVLYAGEVLGEQCIDLVVESLIIVECKGVTALTEQDHAQLLGYLRFTGLPLGLLMNFHAVRLKDGLCRKINWPPVARPPEIVVSSPRVLSVNSANTP